MLYIKFFRYYYSTLNVIDNLTIKGYGYGSFYCVNNKIEIELIYLIKSHKRFTDHEFDGIYSKLFSVAVEIEGARAKHKNFKQMIVQ